MVAKLGCQVGMVIRKGEYDHGGVVGVWIGVLVDDENSMLVRRLRQTSSVGARLAVLATKKQLCQRQLQK